MFKWNLKNFCSEMQRFAEDPAWARLETVGYSHEKDPVYALTVTDFSVPDDQKFHIMIASLHVGGERSALNASMAAIKWLLGTPRRKKYLKKFAILFMPVVNPYGAFRMNVDQYPFNSAKFDLYTGEWGTCWNLPEMSLTAEARERAPELAAWMKTVDEFKPEVLLDWHGANGRKGETMREIIGTSGANHLILPWASRLLAAMRKEICKGPTAVFDLEEYLERIPAPEEIRLTLLNRFRPSRTMLYSDLYAYVKYHALPIITEIGQDETGWRSLKGLMDYALRLPPEYHGSLPVDHVGVDFGNLVVGSYGKTPGEKRRSRAELQSKLDSMITYFFNPMYVGRLGAALTLGPDAFRQMKGDMPITEMPKHFAREFPAKKLPLQKNILAFLETKPDERLLPIRTNEYSATTPPEQGVIENGVTLRMFIPIGHRRRVDMTRVMLNGEYLQPSETDGYELVKGSDGWHLFIHVPPKKSRRLRTYYITAEYEINR